MASLGLNGDFQAAAHLAGNRYRVDRKAVQEIGGAVERIDDPARLVRAAGATLLGQYGVLGIVVADDGDDLPLGGAIDFGDVVVPVLGVDLDAFEARNAPCDDLSGAPCGAHRDIQQGVHSRLE